MTEQRKDEKREISERTETEIKSMTKKQNYVQGYKDGKNDTLNELRVKVDAISDDIHTYPYGMCKMDVLRIIDKQMEEDIE